MTAVHTLDRLLVASATRHPERVAVGTPGGPSLTYSELDALTDRVADRLRALGVKRGDRVGVYMRKSVDSLAAIFGVLKAGAAYVPVDPDAPGERCSYIMNDCAVRAVIAEQQLLDAVGPSLGEAAGRPETIGVQFGTQDLPLQAALDRLEGGGGTSHTEGRGPDDLAYILYTSGSTGRPKGVMLSHANALSFVDWCSETFAPRPNDVFSSHAPFHFDLSILDIYVAIKHGARLVLIGEHLGKDPRSLAPVIADEGITVWYSTPSILSLLASFGRLERYDHQALRLVLFAGEVFPIRQFRQIAERWPHPRYFNLYGPTETNVCTYFEVPVVPDEGAAPFPIGAVCPPNGCRVVDEQGRDVPVGSEGELVVSGPNVMQGYWNLPDRNARAFLVTADRARWYRTGDLVTERDGLYVFQGRRDRMVKRRGYRVELGEIEAGLARNPALREVAVVAVRDGDALKVQAYVTAADVAEPSIIDLKEHASAHLPPYMIPDTFHVVEGLPRTSTDKIDYQKLLEASAQRAGASVR